MKENKIGFAGLGYVGGSLADNFEDRGFKDLVRYSLESEYKDNAELLKDCDVVFISVPTPTRLGVFDGQAVEECLKLVGPDAIAVIKSTIPPGWLQNLKSTWPQMPRTLFVPEFLDACTAREDTDTPKRNIVGIRDMNDASDLEAANLVLELLPEAPVVKICTWDEASLIKYGGNCFFYVKNVMFNIFHDLAKEYGCDYEVIRQMVSSDPRIGGIHTYAFNKDGRGAGGACLPKDFRTFRELVEEKLGTFDPATSFLFHAERRNKKLLKESDKDKSIFKEVYG